DVLARRTRARLLGAEASIAAAPDAAELAGKVLGWSAEQQAAEVAAYTEAVEAEPAAAGLPAAVVPSAPEGAARGSGHLALGRAPTPHRSPSPATPDRPPTGSFAPPSGATTSGPPPRGRLGRWSA